MTGTFELDAAASALERLLWELGRLRHELVSRDELQLAKDRIQSEIAALVSTNDGIAALLGELFTHDATDWLGRYQDALASCDAVCLRDAARRVLDPGAAYVFVSGPPELARALRRLGTVDLHYAVSAKVDQKPPE
jgi:predicted Zn-dependent peptidase